MSLRENFMYIDMNKRNYQFAKFVQHDNSIPFIAHMLKNGIDADLNGYTALAFIRTPKGCFQRDCTINNSQVSFNFDNKILSVAGEAYAEITLYKNKIEESTFVLKFYIDPSIKGVTVEEIPDWDIVKKMLDLDNTTLKPFMDKLQNRFDKLSPQEQSNAEVQLARGDYDSLSERLTDSDNKMNFVSDNLNKIAINIDKFPRLALEINDLPRFNRAKNSLKEGDTLLLNNEEYTFGNGSFTIDKNINIKGTKKPFYDVAKKSMSGGSIVKDGKFVLRGRGYTIENIGVISETVDNGFEANTGVANNIVINNCISATKSHCYLFESYNGEVRDIIVKNCEGYSSTHGFISKAKGIKFINCYSEDIRVFSFGAISDNIRQADKKGIGSLTSFNNCVAKNGQYAFNLYSRDMFSSDNSNSIILKDISIIDCVSIDCSRGIGFGDRQAPAEGTSHNTIYDITVINFVEKNSNPVNCRGLELSRVNGLKVTATLDSEVNDRGSEILNVDVDVNNSKSFNHLTISDNSSYPRLHLRYMYENIYFIRNTRETEIQGFLGAGFDANKTLTLVIDDDFTSIVKNTNIDIKQRIIGKGSILKLRYNGEKWVEIESIIKNKRCKQLDLNLTGNVTLNDGNFIDFVYKTETSNKINLSRDYNSYELLIRPTTAGTHSFGGFESNIVSTGIDTSIQFGKALYLKLKFVNTLNKYIITDSYTTSIF